MPTRTFDKYLVCFGLWDWKADELEVADFVVTDCFHVRGDRGCHVGLRKALMMFGVHQDE